MGGKSKPTAFTAAFIRFIIAILIPVTVYGTIYIVNYQNSASVQSVPTNTVTVFLPTASPVFLTPDTSPSPSPNRTPSPEENIFDKYIAYANGVTSDMYKPEYWLKDYENSSKALLTNEQIAAINKACIKAPLCSMNDIFGDASVFYNENNRQLWASLEIPEYILYKEGEPLSESDFEEYRLSITEADEMHQTYGICVDNTALKQWPEEEIVSTEPDDLFCDEFQIASVKVNEPVLINGITSDGKFYHIVKQDSEGFIEADSVAICRSKQEWLNAFSGDDIMVVTSPQINIELTNQALTMGTVLKLNKKDSLTKDSASYASWGCVIAKLPYVGENGEYKTRLTAIKNEGISIGYIPLTTENVLELAFSYLGNSYSMGEANYLVGFSQLISDVYSCFGYVLPKDAEKQMEMPVKTIEFDSTMDIDAKREQLQKLLPGTVLLFSEHAMLYLGTENEEVYVISSTDSINSPNNSSDEVFHVRNIVISTLSDKISSGNTWLSEITVVKSVINSAE